MSVEPYAWVKWLHVLSSAVLLGVVLGSALHFWFAHRSRRMLVIAIVARNVVRVDRWVTLPALVVQLLTGLGLVAAAGIPVNASWLVVSYGLYLVAFALWLPASAAQARVRDLAQQASTGVPLRSGYRQSMRRWLVCILPMFGALALIFLMMSGKPKFW